MAEKLTEKEEKVVQDIRDLEGLTGIRRKSLYKNITPTILFLIFWTYEVFTDYFSKGESFYDSVNGNLILAFAALAAFFCHIKDKKIYEAQTIILKLDKQNSKK